MKGINDLSLLTKTLGTTEKDGESGVWNIFVQILLPLVLILTFVAVMDIMKYRDVAEKEKENARKFREKYFEKVDQNTLEKQKNYALINLQFQKLLVALEEVKKEKVGKLKLNIFPDAARIKLQAANVLDEDFKSLCRKINDIFKTSLTEQREKDAVYISIINKLEDVFDSEMEERKRAGLPLVGNHYNTTQDEPYIIDGSEITSANRKSIHEKIIEFVNTLKTKTILLQTGLLHRIFLYLLENPENLNEDLRRLADVMNLEQDREEKQRLAKEFYMRLIENLEKKIDQMGFAFHSDTWNKLKILEIGGNR
jgi:hypothetical protein